MEFAEIVKLISETGMGIVAFAALLFGGWFFGNIVMNKLTEKIDLMITNHLPHLQAETTEVKMAVRSGFDVLTKETSRTNELLEKLLEKK